jgi:hypothetical protein
MWDGGAWKREPAMRVSCHQPQESDPDPEESDDHEDGEGMLVRIFV